MGGEALFAVRKASELGSRTSRSIQIRGSGSKSILVRTSLPWLEGKVTNYSLIDLSDNPLASPD